MPWQNSAEISPNLEKQSACLLHWFCGTWKAVSMFAAMILWHFYLGKAIHVPFCNRKFTSITTPLPPPPNTYIHSHKNTGLLKDIYFKILKCFTNIIFPDQGLFSYTYNLNTSGVNLSKLCIFVLPSIVRPPIFFFFSELTFCRLALDHVYEIPKLSKTFFFFFF